MVRNSIGVKIRMGSAIVMVALLLAHWPDRGTFAQEPAMSQSTIEQAFPTSSKCKRCHERVFEEWETSPLSRSIHTPAFRASLDAFLASPAGKDKALCFRCHAPHVREFHTLSNGAKLEIRPVDVPDAPAVLRYLDKVSHETDFLSFGPGEFGYSLVATDTGHDIGTAHGAALH